MIDRLFRALARFAYSGLHLKDRQERKAAAKAFIEMQARRDTEFARLVLTGRWPA
jgi:hypothetical protein